MQNSRPWDPWLLVVENNRLFAQRTLRPTPCARRTITIPYEHMSRVPTGMPTQYYPTCQLQ